MRASFLGSILLRQGVLTPEQLETAVAYHREHRCRLGEALLALGLCTEVHVRRALAEQLGMPFVDLEVQRPTARFLKLLPRRVAAECGVVPVDIVEDRLVVVAGNPFDYRIDEVLRRAAGMPVTIACGVASQVEEVLRRYDELKAWEERRAPEPGLRPLEERLWHQRGISELQRASEEPEIVHTVDSLLEDAVQRGAAEIQFFPEGAALFVRSRVDERLTRLAAFPLGKRRALLARVKSLCGMDLTQELHSQQGSLRLDLAGFVATFHAVTEPQADGEALYLRTEAQVRRTQSLQDLDFTLEQQEIVRSILAARQGLFFVAGSPGGGVPALLAALGALLEPGRRKVVKLSAGFSTEVSGVETIDYTRLLGGAAVGVRSAMEGSPDALLLMDVPDAATMAVACRAAERCLVLAGVVSPHALLALLAYQDQGVPASLFVTPALAALTVRSARRVCEACALEYEPAPEVLDLLSGEGEGHFRRGQGCARCLFRGFRGRVGVYEFLTASALQSLLDDEGMLRAGALPPGHASLRDDASHKARLGLLSPEDLLPMGAEAGVPLLVTA